MQNMMTLSRQDLPSKRYFISFFLFLEKKIQSILRLTNFLFSLFQDF
jgi:hypothetical protein